MNKPHDMRLLDVTTVPSEKGIPMIVTRPTNHPYNDNEALWQAWFMIDHYKPS